MGIPIRTGSGKYTGSVNAGIYHKLVNGKKHMLLSPVPSWAIDKDILDDLTIMHVSQIEITDVQDGTVYLSSMSNFIQNSKPLNRGFGEQLALPLKLWTQSNLSSYTRP